MKIQTLRSEHALPFSVLDISTWPDLDATLLDDAAKQRYHRFKAAITAVVKDHLPISQAARNTRVDRSERDRMIERCFQPAADGDIEGCRVLIPYRHIKPYQRHPMTKGGTAGIFEALMDKNQDIEKKL